jgi:hypothetical protein
MLYAFHENFQLVLSHDEVVHGKSALLSKVPGDDWQKFASLRAFLGFMAAHPGKKLLFMGDELGQGREWTHEESLEWHVLENPLQAGLQRCVRDLNLLVRSEPALHERDRDPTGFEWIDCRDWEQSIVSFVRRAKDPTDFVLVVSNFTPVPRHGYRVGAPAGGDYRELLNTDGVAYGGSKVGNSGVSIATLDDMKVLYSGFDLCAPNTSVSMTINGPAPTILAMFLNTAIDQQLEKFRNDNGREPTEDEAEKILKKFDAARPADKDLAIFRLDWAPDLKEAKSRAAKEKRPMLLFVIQTLDKYGNLYNGHC